MKETLHSWNVSPEEARQLQEKLRQRLRFIWDAREIHQVAGVDVHYQRDMACAVVIVFSFPDLSMVETTVAHQPVNFPYIPGLLAFREGPAVLAAWNKLSTFPNLVFFDAQGIAHPRGLGLAAHLGLWLDIPSVGVAKTRLYGNHQPPGPYPGDFALLYDEKSTERIIGAVLRTKTHSNPLYISPGDQIDLNWAIHFTLVCCRSYRLPEPVRLAHQMAYGLIRESQDNRNFS